MWTIGVLLAAMPAVAQTIEFDRSITQEEFHLFSQAVGDAIYATPVDVAEGDGLLGLDIGIAAVAIPIDEDALWWRHAVDQTDSDLLVSGHLAVPRLIVGKGFRFGKISASYMKIPDSDVEVWGGSLDIPIVRGGYTRPTIALRGTYADVMGLDVFDLQTYGAELYISKKIGPITPYAGAGFTRTKSEGTVLAPPGTSIPDLFLTDEFDEDRLTVGARISLFFPRLVIEATQGDDWTYAAKVAIGF